MKNQRIIIVSNGERTYIMADGKLYGDGIVKIQFTHDCTGKNRKDIDLLITSNQIPLSEITNDGEKQDFMKMLEDISKK